MSELAFKRDPVKMLTILPDKVGRKIVPVPEFKPAPPRDG